MCFLREYCIYLPRHRARYAGCCPRARPLCDFKQRQRTSLRVVEEEKKLEKTVSSLEFIHCQGESLGLAFLQGISSCELKKPSITFAPRVECFRQWGFDADKRAKTKTDDGSDSYRLACSLSDLQSVFARQTWICMGLLSKTEYYRMVFTSNWSMMPLTASFFVNVHMKKRNTLKKWRLICETSSPYHRTEHCLDDA